MIKKRPRYFEPSRRRCWVAFIGATVLLLPVVESSLVNFAQAQVADDDPAPRSSGTVAGLSLGRLKTIDGLVQQEIDDGQMAGAVVCIGRREGIVFRKAYGFRQLKPEPVPMTEDTLFDLASLTKPLATGLSVMRLVDEGKVRLRDPVSRYLPEFGDNGKDKVTVLQLLTHQGGLIPDNPLSDYQDGVDTAWQRIWDLELVTTPGTQFKYTDVGFLVLGKLVERVSGQSLEDYVRTQLYEPLGLSETGYTPAPPLAARAAATEQRDGRWMVGEVHDPRAHLLQGVAGHAGLFSTADDLAVICRMLLSEGQWQGKSVLSPAAIRRMSAPEPVSGGQIRGLSWDKQSGYSSNRGEYFSPAAYGHGGFTGTALWVDPELDLFVIFLSNRLHPDGKGTVNRLAGSVGTVAAAALSTATIDSETVTGKVAGTQTSPASAVVRTGADVLRDGGFETLVGQRVGLITNHTGVTSDGTSLVTLLASAKDVELKALFSPEHGFAGQLDQATIDDQRDQESGLTIYSLYGETRKPTPEMLQGLDVLVFDIQDIGTRFYTYISTMGLAMEAAAENDVRFVVLDRPNPLGGMSVSGPVLDEGQQSFVGFHPIAVQHGMTVGELAQLFKEERRLGVDLDVVRCGGWRREQSLERTGLTWISPSPNMRNFNEARLYPGIGLLETTNLSVGRGTDTPFEWIGAPWIDAVDLARHLNQQNLAGIRFIPTSFTPRSSKYQGERCHAVFFVITDHRRLNAVRVGLTMATALRNRYPDDWDTKQLNRLLADQAVFEACLAGKSVSELEAIYAEELKDFIQRRRRFLLY